jgi:hypothetical protein
MSQGRRLLEKVEAMGVLQHSSAAPSVKRLVLDAQETTLEAKSDVTPPRSAKPTEPEYLHINPRGGRVSAQSRREKEPRALDTAPAG